MARTPEKIIDAHHHLWDLSEMRHTWLAEKDVVRFFGDPAPIQKNYHVPDFKADIGDLPVVASVHIQCGVALDDSVKETEWVQAQSGAHGLANAIVAFCDLTKDDAQADLDAHQHFGNLRGVRQIVGRSAEEDAKLGTNALLEDKAFKHRLKTLVDQKLSFDLQLTPPLMKSAARLFKSVENVPLALCHAGSPGDFSKAGMKEWLGGLKDFAEHGNMICKLSGFGMFEHDWTLASIRGKVLRAIDIFGPQRIAFGSNFPVDKLHASYADTMGAYLTLTEDFSPGERDAMFHDTAAQFYRI